MQQFPLQANHGLPYTGRRRMVYEAKNRSCCIVILLCCWSMMALPVVHTFQPTVQRLASSRIPSRNCQQQWHYFGGSEISDKSLRSDYVRALCSASVSSLLVLAATNNSNKNEVNIIDEGEHDNHSDGLQPQPKNEREVVLSDLGEYDPSKGIRPQREVVVGDPQLRVVEKEQSVTSILKELAAIQQQGPQKYCILGTRHCSYLHQQIIELLAYALVLSGNHVYTSGAGGTHAATIRGALRADRDDLLTVVLPQSMSKQTKESQELLKKVDDIITMPQNDDMSLDVASRICNSYLLSQTDQLISFAFHESNTVIEANKEAKQLDMIVTTLYLD